MGFMKRAIAASVMIAMASSSALAAGEAIRPSALPSIAGTSLVVPAAAGTRLGGRVDHKSNLLGAPLFLIFLGAVAITIGTIVIVNNNDNPKSPG